MDIFGFPFIFQVESFRSCEHVFRHLVEQSLRYLTEEELATLQANGLFDLDPHEGDSEPSWIRTELLPFKIRLVSFQEPQATPKRRSLSISSPDPLRLQIAIDWDLSHNATHRL
jgi:hypothetical protein